MSKVRRINFLGGAGVGKSTKASVVYSIMKQNDQSVELVREYVKDWAYEGRPINPYDQVYFFCKQMKKEYIVLNAGVQYVVSDSPLPLQIVYAKKIGLSDETINGLVKINTEFEKEFPSFNIFLERKDKPYNEFGRYETREDAVEVDELIKRCMDNWNYMYVEFDWNDVDGVIEYIKECIGVDDVW